MKRAARLLLAILFFTPILWAQANVELSRKPAADCPSNAVLGPDGILTLTDCKGSTQTQAAVATSPASGSTSQPSSPGSADPNTQSRLEESIRAKYDYDTYSYAHAKRTFEWQYWSGRIIFWMVMMLVGAGLIFSSIHFYVGLKRPVLPPDKKVGSADDSKAEDARQLPAPSVEDATEFEASLRGIKLKSSVLGLLILTMSMVFFYMYLKFVYPITNVTQ